MEAVKVLRQLWRRRWLVAVGLLAAASIGVVLAYQVRFGPAPSLESRRYEAGIASAEMLVDSPSSQLADLGSGKVATDVTELSSRARLLTNLMAASPLKDHIAQAAGIDPETFIAKAPTPGVDKPAGSGLDSRPIGPHSNVLTVYFNETLPIITADAQAPTPEVASAIATAAAQELDKYLKSVAALDKVPDARKLVVEQLGAARVGTVQKGPGKALAVLAVLILFALWCAAIVLVERFARQWRQVAAEEKAESEAAAEREPAPVQEDLPQPVAGAEDTPSEDLGPDERDAQSRAQQVA